MTETSQLERRVPALLVSGFLGSGKTTLVRHLLADARAQGLRLAIVSNEFGELGIDRALLGGGDETLVELGGGCVCCQLSDELVVTLERLRERVDPDRIVIETSGVALPYDVQLHFWREPVSRWLGDDVTVVVVNAEQVASGRDLEGTFEDQVSSADLLLLNKVDLVPESELPRIEARLRAIEPEAPILRTRHAAVSPELLFPPGLEQARRARRARRARGAQGAAAAHSHEEFESDVLELEPGLAPDAILRRIASEGALRAKGFVETDAGTRVVQGVGARIEIALADAEPPKELIGRVVVIRRRRDARG
ncbi:MAG: GTP-binding protein [Myxococcota bacterium]